MPEKEEDQPKRQADFEALDKLIVLEDDKFKEFVRGHHKFTIDRLKDDPREALNPELVVLTKDMDLKEEITIVAIAVDFNEAEVKQKIMFEIGKTFYEKQQVPAAVILASECWCSKRQQNTDFPDVMPRNDPMRIEAIIVAGAGLDQKQRLTINTPIKRDKENNNIVIDGDPEEFEGAMMFLLDYFWRGYFDTVIKKEVQQKQEFDA
jgi:hypothetical protein